MAKRAAPAFEIVPGGGGRAFRMREALSRVLEMEPTKRKSYVPVNGYEEIALHLVNSNFGKFNPAQTTKGLCDILGEKITHAELEEAARKLGFFRKKPANDGKEPFEFK